MLRDIVGFCTALLRQRRVFTTVALLFGGLFIIRAALPASIPRTAYVLSGALAALAIAFEAWRQEWANASANGLSIPLRGLKKLLSSEHAKVQEDLLRSYLGRRYSLCGTVTHIRKEFVWLESDGVNVLLFFPVSTPKNVMTLSEGQQIEVSGRFVSFEHNCATFRCCKFVTLYWPALAA